MAIHALERASDDANVLLANNRVVFGSTEDVLEPGLHSWSWFNADANAWEQWNQFEATVLPWLGNHPNGAI